MKPKKSHSKLSSQSIVNAPEHRVIAGVFVGVIGGSIFAALYIMIYKALLLSF